VADYFAASQTGNYAPTNPLSQYYPALVTALVRAAERYGDAPVHASFNAQRVNGVLAMSFVVALAGVHRPDANKHNLRIGALNALTLLVENSADVRR